MLIVFQYRILNQSVESLESVIQTQLSPYKLSGYRPTTSFIDASTQDILCCEDANSLGRSSNDAE